MPAMTVRMFAPLMRQRVRVSQRTGFDDTGAPSWGSETVYQAAVVGEAKLVLNGQGQETPSQQSVYLMSNANVGPHPDFRVVLSTQDVASTELAALSPPILAVERYPFLAGQFCTVLRLGRNSGG